MPEAPHAHAPAKSAAAPQPAPARQPQPAHHQPEPGPPPGPQRLLRCRQPPGLPRRPGAPGHRRRLQASDSWWPEPLQPRQLGPRGGANPQPRLGHEVLPVSSLSVLSSPPAVPPGSGKRCARPAASAGCPLSRRCLPGGWDSVPSAGGWGRGSQTPPARLPPWLCHPQPRRDAGMLQLCPRGGGGDTGGAAPVQGDRLRGPDIAACPPAFRLGCDLQGQPGGSRRRRVIFNLPQTQLPYQRCLLSLQRRGLICTPRGPRISAHDIAAARHAPSPPSSSVLPPRGALRRPPTP